MDDYGLIKSILDEHFNHKTGVIFPLQIGVYKYKNL